MKKRDILSLLYQLASPAALILLGLILLVSPDSGAALLTKLIGWGFLLVGAGFLIAALVSRGRNMVGHVIGAVGCFGAGTLLLANPLILAAGIGRVLGFLLLLRGGRDFFRSYHRGGKVLSLITAAVGLVLIALPMTTSRLVFSLLGLVILILGIGMLIDRLRERRYLNSGDDPNIIDAL